MYEDVVRRLRKITKAHKEVYGGSTEESVSIEQAADAIEGLSKLAEAIPHKCECCVGCENEKKNGSCDTGFVLSPKRAKAYIEEHLDWWRKFHALMEAMGTPLPEPPKEE